MGCIQWLHAGSAGAGQDGMAAALKVVQAIARSPSGRPFSLPITDEMVPGYHAVISQAMDLSSIATGLSQGSYTSLGQLPLLTCWTAALSNAATLVVSGLQQAC